MNEIIGLLICGILVIPAIVIAYLKIGRINNPITLIVIWYFFWCMISCTEICDYRVDFDMGRIYVITNILVLIYVACLFIRKKTGVYCYKNTEELHGYEQSTSVNVIRKIVLAFECIFLMMMIVNIVRGKMSIFSIRNAAYSDGEDALFTTTLLENIYFVFVKGFVIFDVISELIQIAKGKTKPNILVIINLVLFCLITLNRIELVRTMLLYIVCMNIIGRTTRDVINQSKSVKRIIRVLILGIVLLIVLRFIVKNSEEGLIQSVVNTVLEDFSISYVTFNQFFAKYNDGFRIIDCTIFDILLGGPIKVLQPILSFFGLKVVNYNGILALYANYAIDVGRVSVLKTNAFYTMYFNFVNGGGLIVPYFVSAILGGLLAILYNFWNRTKSIRSFSMIAFYLHVILLGLLRWEMYAYWSWVTLALLVLFTGKRKIRVSFRN